MSKKIIFFCVIIAMIVSVSFIGQWNDSSSAVYHQHRSAQKENREKGGFNKDGSLRTHLPIIILKTKGRDIPGVQREDKGKLLCEYEIIDNVSSMNVSSDKPTQKGKCLISIRGNSSRRFDKKQYNMTLVNSKGKEKTKSILGLSPESDFVLNGSYIDKSLLRNYMLYNVSSEIMHTAPEIRFCEVMMTDENGITKYEGVYNLAEKIKVSPARINLNKYNPNYKESSFMIQQNENLSDYVIEHLTLSDALLYNFKLEYPSGDKITDDTKNYIQNEIYSLEKKIMDAANTGNFKKVREAIDYESFAEYYIINEFFQNYDAGKNSTFMYRNLGKKYVAGPVWDFDGAMNNFINYNMDKTELRMRKQFYYFYLLKDPKFSALCTSKYKKLRKSYLSEKYLLKYVDESSKYLGSAAMRNCDRWYDGDYDAYYKDVEKVKTYIKERGKWMDEHFVTYITAIDLKEGA